MSDPSDRDERPNINIGGVHIGGSARVNAREIVGEKNVYGVEIEQVFRPLMQAVHAAPAENQPEAQKALAGLKDESVKGKSADDGVMARLMDAVVRLAPDAAAAFAVMSVQKFFSSIAGPATIAVLEKLTRGA